MKKTLTFCILLVTFCMFCAFGAVSASAEAAADLTVTIDTGASVTLKDADGDGYYDIGTADELYAFAAAVNGRNNAINGELIFDIMVNEGTMTADTTGARVWTPIGTETTPYVGIFDGMGCTVNGLYFNDENESYVGLFGHISDNDGTCYSTVKNVGVIDSYFNGYESVGGVVGMASGSYVTVQNCYNTGSVNGSSGNVGGIVGENYLSTTELCYNTGTVSGEWSSVGGVVGYNNVGIVKNCFNQGTVSGTNATGYDIGGVVGYDGGGQITNCYNVGFVSGLGKSVGGVVGNVSDSIITNCYYLSGYAVDGNSTVQLGIGNETLGSTTADVEGQTIGKSSAQFASGEVCRAIGNHVLNKSCVCNTCDTADHDYENGFCTRCDGYQPAVLNNNGTENDTTDDYYEIGNAGQLYWFAQQVDSGNNKINVILTANIMVNHNVLVDGELNPDADAVSGFRQWTPIGTYSWSPSSSIDYRYQGTFDGKGHTVSGLYYNVVPARGAVGFFSYLAEGGTVQNVGIIDSYFYGGTGIAGIVARNMGGTVKSCYNAGRIDGSTNGDWVGGIVGSNEAGGTVINCYNVGKVSGDSEVGGVIGDHSSGTVINCYNVGMVSGDSEVGGVIGGNYSGTVLNCYYLESSETDSFDGTTFKDSAQFASGEVAYLLGEGWGQSIGTDSYPTPGGDKVYRGYTTCAATQTVPVYANVSIAAEKPTHTMAAATCTAPSTCTACGHTEGEAIGHKYDNACDTACNTCGTERTVGEHADADENGYCDACNAELPREGLSGGAIAGIVIGSVIAIGLGAFALFWFVIKKKK